MLPLAWLLQHPPLCLLLAAQRPLLQVLPLLLLAQVVQFLMRLTVGADFPGWGFFIGPFIASALWIPATFVLLLPQYRPVEQNPDRPI